MTGRILLSRLLLLAVLGLAACSQAQPAPPSAPPTETSQPAAVSTIAAQRTPAQSQPAEEVSEPAEAEPAQTEELLLVTPTLGPTATPGILSIAVEKAVGAINAETPQFLGLAMEDWINLLISFAFVILVLTLVARVLLSTLKKLAQQTPTPYDEQFLKLIQPNIRWFLVLITLEFATERLQFLSPELKQWLSQVYFVLIISIIVIILWKLVNSLTLWYRDKMELQGVIEEKEAVVLLSTRAIRFILISVGVVVVLANLGFNISALLTAFGIGGLAISLAAQETIANMISGIIILMDQPFRVGDRIEIQGLDTWGDVVDIGMRTTRIRTLDNRMVIVPNSTISKNQIVNYTFPDPRYRIQTEIGVAYGSDLRQVREVITQALRGIDSVLTDKPVDILFMEFGDSAMILRVRWWVESYQDARRITDRVNEAIYQAMAQAQIEMPAPMMTVELKNSKMRDHE